MHIYSVSVDKRCDHCGSAVHHDVSVWATSPRNAADIVKREDDTIKVWDVTCWNGDTRRQYSPDGTLEDEE